MAQALELTPRLRTQGSITVRAAPERLAAIAQRMQRDLVARLPASARIRVAELRSDLAPRYQQWREGAVLFSLLGALALLITTVGVYSVTAYSVSQRTHEMGIRIAIGAKGADILRLVLREGMRVVAVGLVAGAVLALALGRLIASLLYGVLPYDPIVLVATSVVLTLVAALACSLPARRAMRVDPIEALRVD